MKTTSIDVLMTSAEGALVRLLGLIGRRGYTVSTVQARVSDCGGATQVHLQVSGERPAALLIAQINKLYDVRSVRTAEVAHLAAPAPIFATRAQTQVA